MQKRFLDPCSAGLFTTIWRQTAKPCFFSKSECHRPTLKAKVHSQLNHGSRKTGQAAGAGGLKQNRYVHICDIRPCICGLRLSVLMPAWRRSRSGGKGTVRRKIVRKSKPSNTQDDKKLQGALKKLNVQPIQGVEEVNMFREDGNVLHFSAPKGETTSLSLCTRPVRYADLPHHAVSDFVAWGHADPRNSARCSYCEYVCDLRRGASEGAY
jgi:NAC domain